MGVIKSGKVVIVLQGRFAGRKAIVVKAYDDGNAERRFAHAMVAGIDRAPRKVTRSMSKEKIQKRTKMKPFLKYVNYTHLMPTRYLLEVELKSVVTTELMGTQTNPTARQNARKEVKKLLESKYNNSLQTGKNKWFFQKLRF